MRSFVKDRLQPPVADSAGVIVELEGRGDSRTSKGVFEPGEQQAPPRPNPDGTGEEE
jgi:hypothetical protein